MVSGAALLCLAVVTALPSGAADTPTEATAEALPTHSSDSHAGHGSVSAVQDSKMPPSTGNVTAKTSGRWSSPATWGGSVPGAGAAVRVPAGVEVTLDAVTPELSGLVIEGTVTAAPAARTALVSRWVSVQGRTAALRAGAPGRPVTGTFRVELTAQESDANIMGLGTKFLGVHDGAALSLYGQRKTPWVRLGAMAPAGTKTLTLSSAPTGWKVGDRVAVAPTDYKPLEAETRTVVAVQGTTVTLEEPLTHRHWGTLQTFNGISVDQRAEVANLTRSVVVTGARRSTGDFGGHIMVGGQARAKLDGVEITAMGQLGRKKRYPLHFHLLGDDGKNSSVDGSVIHSTFQRGLVVHQTNNLGVRDNVIYDTVGMQYFLEDGVEVNNTFERNLGMLARLVPDDKSLSLERVYRGDSGKGPERPAAFWITNVHNSYRSNVAIGVQDGWGFAFRPRDVLPKNRTDASLPRNARELQKLPPLPFTDNYVRTVSSTLPKHSNMGYGPTEAGSCVRLGDLKLSDMRNRGPAIVNLSASKCQNAAVWSYDRTPIIGGTFADVRMVGHQNNSVPDAPEFRGARVVTFTDNQPPGATSARLGPSDYFGPRLFGSRKAGIPRFYDTTVVGSYPARIFSPGLTAPRSAEVSGRASVVNKGPAVLETRSGGSVQLSVQVVRSAGYQGPVRLRLPELNAPKFNGPGPVTMPPVTVPAGQTSATLVVDTPAGARRSHPVYVLSDAGGSTVVNFITELQPR